MTGFSVNTNLGALTALRFYQANALVAGVSRDRLSTGLRVIGAHDDASNFSIAQGVRGDIKAWQAVDTALGSAHGQLTATLASATAISDILGELRKKVIEYSAADTARQPIIQADIDALLDNIDTVANSATYNGFNLIISDDTGVTVTQPPDEGVTFTINKAGGGALSGGAHALLTNAGTLRLNFNLLSGSGGQVRIIYNGSVVASSGLGGPNSPGTLTYAYTASPTQSFQVEITGGPKVLEYEFFLDTPFAEVTGSYKVQSDILGNAIDVQSRSMLAADLGLTPFNLNSAQTSLAQLDAAQAEVNENLGYYGAKLRQVDFAREGTRRFVDALTEGLGSLVDADLHRESAQLAAARVREQLALGQLSLAHRRPQVILGLLDSRAAEQR